jgi:hypothetical protein
MVNLSKKSAGALTLEGDYTSWTKIWDAVPSESMWTYYSVDYRVYGMTFIDETNNRLVYFGSYNYSVIEVYNLLTGALISNTALDSDYTQWAATSAWGGLKLGCTVFSYGGRGGASRSLQTYILLLHVDVKTIEVWRNGVALWSRDVSLDSVTPLVGEISISGQHIAIANGGRIVVYKGQ